MNQDFKELFAELNTAGVRYLVVGAYAVTFHAEPRYTKDLDIWVEPKRKNAKKVWSALKQFGAPLSDVAVEDFTNCDMVFQIGVEPNRIDILMDVIGVEFAGAWQRRVTSNYAGEPTGIIGLDDLIKAKKAAGRPQDLLDLENLITKRNNH